MYSSLSGKRPNFPTPPKVTYKDFSFPNDLANADRNYFIELQFANYSISQQFGAFAKAKTKITDTIRLPIPRKLIDTTALAWSEGEMTSSAAGLGISIFNSITQKRSPSSTVGSSVRRVGEAMTGQAINPLMYLFFQRPVYKEFSFSWTLAPETRQETETLKNIINAIQLHSLPTNNGVSFGYPDIVYMKLYPDDQFLFEIKPCIVQAVQVDYTGAGGPSFFKNGAPTVVNLSISFKEMQLRDRSNGENMTLDYAKRFYDYVKGSVF